MSVSSVVRFTRAEEGLVICFVHALTHSLILNVFRRDLGHGSQTILRRTTLNLPFLILASTALMRGSLHYDYPLQRDLTTRGCLCQEHATLDTRQLPTARDCVCTAQCIFKSSAARAWCGSVCLVAKSTEAVPPHLFDTI